LYKYVMSPIWPGVPRERDVVRGIYLYVVRKVSQAIRLVFEGRCYSLPSAIRRSPVMSAITMRP